MAKEGRCSGNRIPERWKLILAEALQFGSRTLQIIRVTD